MYQDALKGHAANVGTRRKGRELSSNAKESGTTQEMEQGGAIRARSKTGGGIRAQHQIKAGEVTQAQRNRAEQFGLDTNNQ